jgi:hypothetical protein
VLGLTSGHGGVEDEQLRQVNALARHREFWLRDLDGCVVVVAGTYGTA